MMQGELFKRYIWLIELIYRCDGITRDEINRQWRLSHLNNSKVKGHTMAEPPAWHTIISAPNGA